jgi:hypothetical protein
LGRQAPKAVTIEPDPERNSPKLYEKHDPDVEEAGAIGRPVPGEPVGKLVSGMD